MAAASCCRRWAIWAALGSRFTTGLFFMFLALFAYRSVFMLSSRFTSAGLTQAIMTVRLLPPRESCNQPLLSVKQLHVGLNLFMKIKSWKYATVTIDPEIPSSHACRLLHNVPLERLFDLCLSQQARGRALFPKLVYISNHAELFCLLLRVSLSSGSRGNKCSRRQTCSMRVSLLSL